MVAFLSHFSKKKGAVTVFSWGVCMTFEVLEGSMLELSTRRHHKSATFVQTQLLYQFEVNDPRKFHLHFLVLVFRDSVPVCCVCVHSLRHAGTGRRHLAALDCCCTGTPPGAPLRPACRLGWLHWTTVVLARLAHPAVLHSSTCAAQRKTQSDP